MLAAVDGSAVRCPVVLRTLTDPNGPPEQE